MRGCFDTGLLRKVKSAERELFIIEEFTNLLIELNEMVSSILHTKEMHESIIVLNRDRSFNFLLPSTPSRPR
jgi:hypothetical protein